MAFLKSQGSGATEKIFYMHSRSYSAYLRFMTDSLNYYEY
jgi:hypothetical protein